MAPAHEIFDRDLIVRRRNRHAGEAHRHDFLLARTAEDIAERLSIVKRTFPTVLVLGARHGLLGRAVSRLPGVRQVISLDSAGHLLFLCDPPRVLASEEALPLAEQSLDLVVSAHALETVNDVPGVLVQVQRALKPDGLFLAAFCGGATLTELRQSWLAAESEITGGASPRVAPFVDVREAGALMVRAGFALPVADSDTVTVTYETPLALMAELRAMGSSNMLLERSRRPVTRGLLLRAAGIYRERFGLPNGRVPATFEVVTLTGWRPHDTQPKPLAPGSAKARLADALGTTERKLER